MTTKVCSRCECRKSTAAFTRGKSAGGLRPECRQCRSLEGRRYYRKNRSAVLAQNKKWRDANPKKSAAARRRRLYGTDGSELFKRQNGRCGICRTDLRRKSPRCRHLDHDHKTGRTRGWLCFSCNVREGWFRNHERQVRAWNR